MCPTSGRLGRLQHVAEPALRLDDRLGRVLVELAPEVRDVGLDDARVAVEVVLPHVVEDLRLRQHPVRVEHEVAEELELCRGQLDLRVTDGDLVRVLVHRQLARADDGVLFVVHRATQDGLDARDDLVEGERLRDVVVTADREPGDLVLGVVLRGEEQDRRGVARRPEALGDAEAVHVGEHDVEDDQVGLLLEHGGDRLGTVADRADGEPGEAQRGREEVADVRFVVDDQDLGAIGHGPIL
ncbi:Transcriptional regulator (modular protein) [Curtobacterium sp. ER1/6]|nr:Transcriptional regulator (modular protein) [Curtobacterium sp. ER1/6]